MSKRSIERVPSSIDLCEIGGDGARFPIFSLKPLATSSRFGLCHDLRLQVEDRLIAAARYQRSIRHRCDEITDLIVETTLHEFGRQGQSLDPRQWLEREARVYVRGQGSDE